MIGIPIKFLTHTYINPWKTLNHDEKIRKKNQTAALYPRVYCFLLYTCEYEHT